MIESPFMCHACWHRRAVRRGLCEPCLRAASEDVPPAREVSPPAPVPAPPPAVVATPEVVRTIVIHGIEYDVVQDGTTSKR